MSTVAGSQPARTALDHLRLWHLRRATGTLAMEIGDRSRRLHLVDGGLHLRADSSLVERFRELPEPGAGGDGRARWSALLGRIAENLDQGRVRFAEFLSGHGSLTADLFGPLPTRSLLRIGYALRARRGEGPGIAPPTTASDRLTVRRDGPVASGDTLGWSPEELWILERLRSPMTASALADDCPFPPETLASVLAGLMALDDVVAADVSAAATAVAIDDLAALLSERVAASLRERPLAVDAETYRSRIAELLGNAGGQAHDELLGVAADASPEELQNAFEEFGRWVHPDSAARFGLGDRGDALRFLFERATEAYRTLADPQLRVAYFGSSPVEGGADGPSFEERRKEVRQLARRIHDQALFDESIGEIHTALQLMEQAVRTDPRVEYWVAHGRLLSKNPAWTGRAINSFRSALELDPQSGEIRFALGQLYEKAGEEERARLQYQAAAAARPPHAGARDAIDRLGRARADRSRGRGLFSRR